MSDVSFRKVVIVQCDPLVNAIAKQRYADRHQKCVEHFVYMSPVGFSYVILLIN